MAKITGRLAPALLAGILLMPAMASAFGAAGAASSPYLKLPMGARGTGMGEAFTGIADDAEAMFYNPAGMTQLESAHLLLMHDESFGGIRYEHLAVAVPADKVGLDIWGSVGFSYTLVAIEDIPRTRILPGTPDTYDQAYADRGFKFTSGASDVAVSYAWQATKLYSIGATVKFLNEKVDTVDGWGMAGDIGLFSKLDDMMSGLQAGMTIQNIGTSPTHAPLPVNLRMGLGHIWKHPFSDPDDDADKLSTDVDFIMPIVPVDGSPHLAVGTEYFRWFGHSFGAARVGYRFPTDLGALAGLTAGFGVGYQGGGNDVSLDYTFVPYGELGNAHRIALNAFFGSKPRVAGIRKTGPLVVPYGLKGKSGDQSALLSWQPSPVKVDGYNVYMAYNPATGPWYRVKSHNHYETTVNKLYNGYNIYFAVSAIRKKADGSWEETAKSAPVLVRPSAPRADTPSGTSSAKPAPAAKATPKPTPRPTPRPKANLEPPALP
jgi:hypothetical protein